MIMHLCVNNFECGIEKEDTFLDSFRPGAGGGAPRQQKTEHLRNTAWEIRIYVCIYIASFGVS